MARELASLRDAAGNEGDRPLVEVLRHHDPDRLRAIAAAACDDRYPYWSRSYSHDTALVAGWHARVGVDLEHAMAGHLERFGRALEELMEVMATPDEREWILEHAPAERPVVLLDLWSGKEALAKALGNALDYDPAFLVSPATWSGLAAQRWAAHRVEVPDGGAQEAEGGGAPIVAWVVFETGAPVATSPTERAAAE